MNKFKLFFALIATTASVATTSCSKENSIAGESISFTWTLEGGTLTISGTCPMPDYYAGTPWYAQRSSITSVIINEGITSIGRFAFGNCQKLTTVTIPNSVTSIGDYAFYDCASLTTITIPATVTSIGYCVFDGCNGLMANNVDADNPNYSSENGVLFNKDKTTLLQYPNGKSGNYTIPASVTSIGVGAFNNCGNLTTVTIPNSVTSIGEDAFSYCDGLTTVTIPASVTDIRRYAFYSCYNLAAVHVNWSSPDAVTFGDDVFFGIKNDMYLYVPTESLATYKTGAQWVKYYFRAENIVDEEFIPLTWTLESDTLIINGSCPIPNYQYSGVPWYTQRESIILIIISEGIISIGDHAFSDCKNVNTVIIPASVTSIGVGAFKNCGNLTTVTIPNSVTSIGNDAFYFCNNLSAVHVSWSSPDAVTLGYYDVFHNIEIGAKLYVPNSYLAAYKASPQWLEYFSAENIIGE
ncbi:MAG: leucine-rich repeat domain-containing protein [Prevotellaceae bacterium]|jgi:hypothetical protein|nr:leucine-rich repeat domain-containing protein [Prevotellaceae bacterium]